MLQKYILLFSFLILIYPNLTCASDINDKNKITSKKAPLKPCGVIPILEDSWNKNTLTPDSHPFKISASSAFTSRKIYKVASFHTDKVSHPSKKIAPIINFNNQDLTNKENQLELSNEIGQFLNIKKAYLRNCRLHDLPGELFKLTMLTVLNLSQNDFSTGLREAIEGKNPLQKLSLLTHLKELYLNSCRINVLPSSLRELKKLSYVELKENPLEMTEQYFSIYFQQKTIIIVGEQGCYFKYQVPTSKMSIAYLINIQTHSQVQ